jgi:hypothetical protein
MTRAGKDVEAVYTLARELGRLAKEKVHGKSAGEIVIINYLSTICSNLPANDDELAILIAETRFRANTKSRAGHFPYAIHALISRR